MAKSRNNRGSRNHRGYSKNTRNIRKANRGNYSKSFTPYPFYENEEIELSIDSLSHLGHGVGRIDHTPQAPATGEAVENWVVFVPFGLPGETLKVQITHNAKKNSIGKIVEVLEPSADRISPKCSHFFYCGGCQFQHLSYEKQLEFQTEEIRQQLIRLAGLDESIQVNKAISGSQIWNYRSKITPHYRKPQNGKINALGFLHHSDKNQLINIKECAIAMPQLNAQLVHAKKDLQGRAHSIKEDGSVLLRANQDSVETHPSNSVQEKVGDLTFHFLARDFFQNNPFILESFTNYVAEQASSSNQDSGKSNTYLIDAYCGCGLFALSSAHHFEKVAGVEVSASSADWARYNAKANGIENTTFLAASAEKIFDGLTFPSNTTTVIIDPPRAGCSQDFLRQLFDFGPSRAVYVSCEPSTQMRDLSQFLQQGYTIDAIQPFDLFPHTRHLECVITLTKDTK